MLNGKKIIVVMPAYNAERTIAKAIEATPKNIADEILVIDDGSRDRSKEIAMSLGATVISHDTNHGYGAAQKTGYKAALERGADVAVMIHSDFQYDPTLLPNIVAPIVNEGAQACFGSRMANKGDARKGGMPWWRFIANKALTIAEESVLHLKLSEYHTGYRAYSRATLQRIPFELNSDNYVFDTEMIAELAIGKMHVAEIPIPTRYLPDSQSPNFRKSVQYGFSTLNVLRKVIMHRLKMQKVPQFFLKQP